MKKTLIILIGLLILVTINADAQKIKLFTSYEKNIENGSRYVVVLSDNTIWWYAPGAEWKQNLKDGLPAGNIKFLSAFEKNIEDGTRYVVVMADLSIWWYAPNQAWKKTALDGLPK